MIDETQFCCDDNCLYEFCRLIDLLANDIVHLEEEVVKTRYALSTYLKSPYDECLRTDILSDLAGRYSDNPAYQIYMELLYNNQDPMESDECVRSIIKLANGQGVYGLFLNGYPGFNFIS
jgi:hypothetical protein